MRRGNAKIGIVAAVIAAATALFFVTSYNGLVTAREAISGAQADIAAQLQRRGDLIPNLINSVKGYMDHENEAIRAVSESRAKLMDARGMYELAQADGELTGALRSFSVIVENYPDLKANTTFVQLQDELAGTENRIATSRRDHNEAVRSFNAMIKRLPTSIIAGMLGYEDVPYFEADAAAASVPEVRF